MLNFIYFSFFIFTTAVLVLVLALGQAPVRHVPDHAVAVHVQEVEGEKIK